MTAQRRGRAGASARPSPRFALAAAVLGLVLAGCGTDATSPFEPPVPAEAPKEGRGGGNGQGKPGGGATDPFLEDFESWDPARWTAGDHPLGRGAFRPANVAVAGGLLHLVMPAGTYDGGEIRSASTVQYGTFEARIRASDAPGSLTAFFLYEYTTRNIDEIDIEIFGDGSGRVLLTTWLRSRQTNLAEIVLPFDPTEDFHVYAIEWSRDAVRFRVDGEVLAEFTEGVPRDPMYVMANAWWPTWLEGPRPTSDRHAEFDWIRH